MFPLTLLQCRSDVKTAPGGPPESGQGPRTRTSARAIGEFKSKNAKTLVVHWRRRLLTPLECGKLFIVTFSLSAFELLVFGSVCLILIPAESRSLKRRVTTPVRGSG